MSKLEDVSGQWDVVQTLFFNSVTVSPVVCSRERAHGHFGFISQGKHDATTAAASNSNCFCVAAS